VKNAHKTQISLLDNSSIIVPSEIGFKIKVAKIQEKERGKCKRECERKI